MRVINNTFIFRFHDDNQFWRYTGEVRNPFGQDLYKVQLTCRSIFTDPNNHQELHDNHVKTFNNYYGYWFKEDLFAYDARYQVKEVIVLSTNLCKVFTFTEKTPTRAFSSPG